MNENQIPQYRGAPIPEDMRNRICCHWMARTEGLEAEGVALPDVAAAKEMKLPVRLLRHWTLTMLRETMDRLNQMRQAANERTKLGGEA